MKILFAFIFTTFLWLNASHAAQPPTPQVDLSRFLGKWYSIASIPQYFERNCVATNANYSLNSDGTVGVLNYCNDKTLDGKLRAAHGVAWVPNKSEPAKLKVSFFKPIYASYWILDVGPNYEYAMTGNPNKKYLWILSRTPHMDEGLYQQLLHKATALGFDTAKLVRVLQP